MDGEDHHLKPPSFDVDDEKNVSGLSTIVVASIQEAKDRISQIEYIFCSQLYPNFQSKTKSLQKFYSESIKSLEDKWKEKDNELLLQIEKMRVENQRLLEENGLLKIEEAKAKAAFEPELMAKQRKIEELERKIRKKCEEVDGGMVLHKNLVELVEAKGSLVLQKEKQLMKNKERTKGLLMKVKKLEEEVEDLQEELRRRNAQMNKEIKLREKLYANNLELTAEIANSEKERKRLLAQMGELDENVAGIRMELGVTIQKVQEGEELHKQLLQQMDLKSSESLENKKRLDECEKDKKLLLDKVKCLEEGINKPYKVSSATCEFPNGNGTTSCQKLLKQVESITSELQAKKKKRVQVTEAYKQLKSQHSLLREKVGLTMENMIQKIKGKDRSDPYKHKSPIRAAGHENKLSDNVVAVCDTNKMKKDMLEDDKGVMLSPPSTFYCIPYCPSTTKSGSVSGTKRPASSWRQTRSHQSRAGPDPHDDFLDTPLENIRANLNKTPNKKDLLGPIQKDISMDTSDDETQDLNAQSSPPNRQSSVSVGRNKNFKYIEPVRKKAERENLKGVECEQCKKFYDVLLPNGDSKSLHSRKQSLRCEHHDGVSRHRYRYVPPMTPEGFWNIGFESEI